MSATISIEGAAQVLRPAAEGMPYVRNSEGAFTTAPGGLLLSEGRIAGLDGARRADVRVDARGAAVMPGFVDCHTHLPFAGWRADEYAMKVAGADYAQLAAAGGGIAASARALAQSSDEQVLELSA